MQQSDAKMKGGAAPRRKGDNFERRVKKYLQCLGFFCVRQPRSAFPDLVAIKQMLGHPINYCIECKMNKYISNDERSRLEHLGNIYFNKALIAYKGEEGKICFCDLNYDPITP